MADIIQIRRDTQGNWLDVDPILAQGEFAVEVDTNQFKIGNGTDVYSVLPYVTQGPDGPQGGLGPEGPQGDTGPEGPEGPEGPRGPQGLAGNDSVVQGPEGPQGDTGPEGQQGIQGLQGGQGTKGDTGDAGPKGDTGEAGSKGDTGDQGIPGEQGGVGPAGDQGIPGEQGERGDPGGVGPAGDPGEQGIPGPAAVSTDADNKATLGTDGLVYVPESSGGGGVTPEDSIANAKGAALSLEQALLAKDGQPALTVLAVGATNTGKVQGSSLGDGNVVEVYASGSDYSSSTVLYREFMSAGEPICFTGLNAGAIITSTQGFYGMSEQIQGNNESPMPLLSLGLAFTGTFMYAFRNSQDYPGGGNATGQVSVVNGPLPSTVTFTKNGNQVEDQAPRDLQPFELTIFYTNANGEYFLASTSPVMACIQANMGTNPPLVPGGPEDSSQRFYDARLIMPLTDDGITWPRSGYVSAPYANTKSKYYVRDGVIGNFPTVNPGSPVNFVAGTGADDSDYEPRGATRLRANGLVVANSGADSAGLEASPMLPVSAMSQVVAQPFWIDDSGDGGNSGVAIASPFEGTAKVYAWNSTTSVAELAYTVPLARGTAGQGIAPATPEDQYIPCAGMVANEPTLDADPSVVQLVGNLGPGYIVADVPITVVAQNALPTLVPSIRSQNGTTTTSIVSDDDETLMLGWTPSQKKAEITEDADGYTRKRVLDNTGAIAWPLT